MSSEFFDPGAQAARAQRVPLWRWALWYVSLAGSIVVFYMLLTPIWIGLRWAAWVAEFRARRHRS